MARRATSTIVAKMPTRLRQVVLTVEHLDPVLDQYRELLAAGPGDVDPGMAEFGLTHEVLRVGTDTYVEICAPIDRARPTTASRFLDRSGPGGYMAVVEVDDASALRQRVADGGWAIPLQQLYHGNELTQLHPRDFGTLLEADQIGSGHDWHYPALERATSTSTVTGIVAIDVAVAEPAAMAQRWAQVFAQPAPAVGATTLELDGGGTVRFVAAGARTGVVAFDVAAADRSRAGESHQLGGVTVRFV